LYQASKVRGHVYVFGGGFASFDGKRLALGTVPTVWYCFFFCFSFCSMQVKKSN